MMVIQEIERAHQLLGVIEILIDLLTAVPMVPQGHAVDARIDEEMVIPFAQAFAMGGVFAIGNHEINVMFFDKFVQRKMDRIAAHLSDDITIEENAHADSLLSSLDRAIFPND